MLTMIASLKVNSIHRHIINCNQWILGRLQVRLWYWVILITSFIVLENPYIAKQALGSNLAIPPMGYSFMYLYTGLFLLFIVSIVAYHYKKYVLSWILLLPAIILTIAAYLRPIINTSLETTYLWVFPASILLINIIGIIVTSFINIRLDSSCWSIVSGAYNRLFSVQEFTTHPRLYYLLLGSIAFLVFALKNPAQSITQPLQIGTYICPTWFQDCYQWFFLSISAYEWWTVILMMLLAGSFTTIVYKRYTLGHFLLSVPVIWHLVLVGLLTHSDFYYGHVMFYIAIINTVLLFLPNKTVILGWLLLLIYVLSLGSKMTDSWFLGNVFRAMDLGLPVIGDRWHMLAAWAVILTEGIIVWFLLSKYRLLKYGALASLLIFHVYSIPIIQYFFPAVVIVVLLTIFATPNQFRLWSGSLGSRVWIFVLTAVLVLGQSVSLLIPGDSRLTAEGNRFGMHMFNAKVYCYVTTKITAREGITYNHWRVDRASSGYCEPYYQWYLLKQQCLQGGVSQAVLTMDIAINQEPYSRVVNQVDVCQTEYHFMQHNDWITIDSLATPVIEYPDNRSQEIL